MTDVSTEEARARAPSAAADAGSAQEGVSNQGPGSGEQIALQLLEDAYCDVVAVLRSAQPRAAAAILAVVEQRAVDALARICRERPEGAASTRTAVAAGERLSRIMRQAHDGADVSSAA